MPVSIALGFYFGQWLFELQGNLFLAMENFYTLFLKINIYWTDSKNYTTE